MIVVIQSTRHDQPIRVEITAWGARWYLWVLAGAALFVIGFGALFTEEAGGLSELAWAVWILSWLAGAIVGVIGVGLGATRFASHHRG